MSRKDRIKKLEGILVDPDRRCRKQVVSVGGVHNRQLMNRLLNSCCSACTDYRAVSCHGQTLDFQS